ncbi:MAG: glutaredoxin family protein [Pseudomonadales bacterium]|nr:glutaredoxin family protein [Pseudomonadales bacterium]MCP5183819.1 glutaredoxin family protein [Pseudomonadales bacterium]
MGPLILYSTSGCALCEQALELLFALPELHGAGLTVVDVADDDVLAERYGARLPVLAFAGDELDAPFDRHAVVRWWQHVRRD